MRFGQKLRLKKDWEYNDIITFEKGDILQVANYQHKYGMKLYHPGVSLVDFKFDWQNRDSKIDEYFEAVEMCDDRLAELEKVMLDYYLAKGYKFGVGGWQFVINISTSYKRKEIQITFRQDICSDWETVLKINKQSTKEMFDEAIEHFYSVMGKGLDKLLKQQEVNHG